MNITDIDDKIINRANANGENPIQMASGLTAEFLRDLNALGITSVNLYAKASEHVVEIIDQVKTLVEKGYGYQVDGDVFYDVSKFSGYGELSNQNPEQLVMHRIDPDPRKKSVVDFALWKSQKPGEPAWDSPWGKGRPGWHIEDTAITTTYFGPQYDIHGGGLDLIFPHHEAEIAQAEAATGVKPLVKYWLHSGLLTVKGTRMGKSMGNFITIREILQRHDPEALRLYYAMSHYRSPLEFDETNVAQAEQVLNKLRSSYSVFRKTLDGGMKSDDSPADSQVEKLVAEASKEFSEAMDDDFNTPRALAALIGFARDIEPYGSKGLGRRSVARVVKAFDYFGGVFGILQSAETRRDDIVDGLITELVELRNEARKRSDWKTADEIRKKLADLGVVLEDSSTSTRWYVSASRNTSS
jgi:cysteinyl-tRNA synthetase